MYGTSREKRLEQANPPMQNHSTAVLESLNFTPRSHLNLSSLQVGAHEQKTNDLDSNGSPGETLRSQQARIQISVGARDSFWKVVTYSIIIHVGLIQHHIIVASLSYIFHHKERRGARTESRKLYRSPHDLHPEPLGCCDCWATLKERRRPSGEIVLPA
jgi:hypothetical protein